MVISLISHNVSESHLPDCLLSCRDAGAGLVISHIKLDNFLSLNLRILSVRTFNREAACNYRGYDGLQVLLRGQSRGGRGLGDQPHVDAQDVHKSDNMEGIL